MDSSMKSECTIDSNGTKRWYLDNKIHREGGPAVEYVNGSKYWFINGRRHRIGGPAIEHPDGTKYWYLNSELHREDGPAVESANGYKAWYLNGKGLTFNQWLSEVWDTLSKEDQKKYAFNGFEYEE